MSTNKKVNILKIIMFIVAIAIIIGIIIYLFPVMKNISTKDGQIEFKEKINSLGIGGIFALLGLQIAQIVLFILPGEPIEILAGMCYGGIWGTVFILISDFIISAFIFFMVRKYGVKFIYNFCNDERIKKIENSKLLKNPKKIELIMLILFLIPGTPKDLLVYISGLLPIKPFRFLIISTIARIPSVISSTIAGGYIAIGNWKMSIIMYMAIVIIVAVAVFIFNKLDKEKITDEAMKIVK